MKKYILITMIATISVSFAGFDFDFLRMLQAEGEKYKSRIEAFKNENQNLQQQINKIKKNVRQRAENERQKADAARIPDKKGQLKTSSYSSTSSYGPAPEKLKQQLLENKAKLREAMDYLPGISYWPEFSNKESRVYFMHGLSSNEYPKMVPFVNFYSGNIGKLPECKIIGVGRAFDDGTLGKEYVVAAVAGCSTEMSGVSRDFIAIDIPVSKVTVGQKYNFANLFVLENSKNVTDPREYTKEQTTKTKTALYCHTMTVNTFRPVKLWAGTVRPKNAVEAIVKQVLASDMLEIEINGKMYRLKMPVVPQFDVIAIKAALGKILKDQKIWVTPPAKDSDTEYLGEVWTNDFSVCDYLCGIGLTKKANSAPVQNDAPKTVDLLE